MKTFRVLIKATVTKEIEVEAENEDLAAEEAHQIFDPSNTGEEETYDQETVEVTEITKP